MPIAVNSTMEGNTRHRTYGLISALVVVLTFSTAALPATAQQSVPTEVSQEELAAFAAANQRIQELRQEWMPKISEAETSEENLEIRQRATEEMATAVQDEGLTVEQYNQIANAAQNDPEVMQQLQEHLQSPQ